MLAVALLVSACSDAQEPGGDPTATGGDVGTATDAGGTEPTPTGPDPAETDEPTDPVPAPSPQPEPERPAAMDDTGEKGAVAAAEYFFELYNYATTTGDVGGLEDMSHEDCGFCSSVITSINGAYEDGGRIVGSIATIDIKRVEPTVDGLAFALVFGLEVSDGTRVSSGGEETAIDGVDYDDASLGIQKVDEGWVVLTVRRGTE